MRRFSLRPPDAVKQQNAGTAGTRMNMLDMRTVILMGVFSHVLCAVVVVELWRVNRRRFDGLGYQAADHLLQTVALVLVGLRGIIPDWLSMVGSNTMVLGGAILGLIALERFTGKQGPQWPNVLLLVVFAGVHAWFCVVQPDLAARNFNFTLALLLVCGQALWLTQRRVEPAMRPLLRWVNLAYGGYVAVCGARLLVMAARPDPNNDFFRSGLYDILALLAFIVLFILLTFGVMAMVNRRLVADLQAQEGKFAKAFHTSPYAVTLTRWSDGKIIEANQGFSEITGYGLAEAIGKTSMELRLWGEERDREMVREALRRDGRVRGMELQFRKKNGAPLTGLLSADRITINNEACILTSVNDISERKEAEEKREQLVREREKALSEVKVLSGLLPICAACKKIRDDQGYWNQIEAYIATHSEANFTHGICPECTRKYFGELMDGEK